MTDFLNGKTWMHSLQKQPKKNVYQGPIHYPGQLNSLGLWPVVLCGINKCGPLTLKKPNNGTHKFCR